MKAEPPEYDLLGTATDAGDEYPLRRPANAKIFEESSSVDLELRPTREGEIQEVTRFLASVFQASAGARFISSEIFFWKYFQPRLDWTRPRSYILRKDGVLAAHLGIWPVHFRVGGERRWAMQALDWAASPQYPGAGSQLRGIMDTLADFQLGISGTEAAQKTRLKLGFRPWGNITTFVRAVRPWLRMQKLPAGSPLRRGARLLRDFLRAPLRSTPLHWTAEIVGQFDKTIESSMPLDMAGDLRPYHSAAHLNYFLACPASHSRGVVFRYQGSLCGYALLTRIAGQARIACLRVSHGWDTAYQLATQLAAQDTEAYEVLAQASHPGEAVALRKNGYRVYDVQAAALKDPHRMVSPKWALGLQMTESDAFFL